MKAYTIKELRKVAPNQSVKSFLDWLEAQEEDRKSSLYREKKEEVEDAHF